MTTDDTLAKKARQRRIRQGHDNPNYADGFTDACEQLRGQVPALTEAQTERIASVQMWLHERYEMTREPELSFRPESRPGRGQDLTAFWVDGEHACMARIDVYGHGETYVWSLDLLHGGEECDCIDCGPES